MFFTRIQRYFPQHILSRALGYFANKKLGWLTKWMINCFVSHYQVNMEEAIESDTANYPTFNDFFTRRLKPSARILDTSQNGILSPVDGLISQIGQVEGNKLFQIKGRFYTVEELLAEDLSHLTVFENGAYLTAYLAPRNYHRVHMPVSGRLIKTHYVPGRLFSVNPRSVYYTPKLFARNERLVCFFETVVGLMVVVLVGALLVGHIITSWQGKVCKHSRVCDYLQEGKTIFLHQGEELGYFQMGSAVILLFEKNKINWMPHQAQDELKFGQLIGNAI